MLSKVEEGVPTNYQELYTNILKFRNDEDGIENFQQKVEAIKPTKAILSSDKIENKEIPNKKKFVKDQKPEYMSEKDHFYWEDNLVKDLESQMKNYKEVKVEPTLVEKGEPKSSVKRFLKDNKNYDNAGNFIKWSGEKTPKAQANGVSAEGTVINGKRYKNSTTIGKSEENPELQSKKKKVNSKANQLSQSEGNVIFGY